MYLGPINVDSGGHENFGLLSGSPDVRSGTINGIKRDRDEACSILGQTTYSSEIDGVVDRNISQGFVDSAYKIQRQIEGIVSNADSVQKITTSDNIMIILDGKDPTACMEAKKIIKFIRKHVSGPCSLI